MKGKIPVIGAIELGTGEEHWNLLLRGLVNELQISGVLEIEPGRRVRIRMLIREIYSPEQINAKTTCVTTGTFDSADSNAINRITEHLSNALDSKKWIMFGEIEGSGVPIIVVHYSLINLSFYTQKTTEESSESFFSGLVKLRAN